MDTATLRINEERFKANFEALSKIGATAEGGVHRPTFSPAHFEARAWFRERIESAGLKFSTDGAGNHSATFECAGAKAKTLLLGSHLDSVPNGGRFDGAIGVLSALAVVETIKEAGVALPVNLEVIDFTDEEGTLIGLMGSSAFAGKLKTEDLANPRGGPESLRNGLDKAGLTEKGILGTKRNKSELAGYLEVHIEQGKRLSEAGAQIGVVTSIVGLGSFWLTFNGRANHAGTTPMKDRHDASLGASAFTLTARELVLNEFPDCVVNIGQMHFSPGAFNIIPETVNVALEYRAPDAETFEKLEMALLEKARSEAESFDLKVDLQPLGNKLPAQMHSATQTAIKEAARKLELSAIPLVSYAGHDAQSLAPLCPAGMIFIPSIDGISHAPGEFTKWDDCIHGANVLLQATLNLALETPSGH